MPLLPLKIFVMCFFTTWQENVPVPVAGFKNLHFGVLLAPFVCIPVTERLSAVWVFYFILVLLVSAQTFAGKFKLPVFLEYRHCSNYENLQLVVVVSKRQRDLRNFGHTR